MTRDQIGEDDLGPLSWTEQVRPGTSVRELLVELNTRLPHPTDSRRWVARVRRG